VRWDWADGNGGDRPGAHPSSAVRCGAVRWRSRFGCARYILHSRESTGCPFVVWWFSMSSVGVESVQSETLAEFGVRSFSLPGKGDRGPRCGEWLADSVCDGCGELGLTTHGCGRRSCPDCWAEWARKAAVRATVRVQSFRYTQPNDYRRQVAHAVVSPEDGEIETAEEYWDWTSRAAEIAEEKGFRGCSVIPHPYRATEEAKREFEATDTEAGLWVWLRSEKEDWTQHVRWSPHYHIIGPTTADMDAGESGEEAVYRFIRSVDRFDGTRDSESHRDVYGLFRYLLSHTGYPSGSNRQTVTVRNSSWRPGTTWSSSRRSGGNSLLRRSRGCSSSGRRP